MEIQPIFQYIGHNLTMDMKELFGERLKLLRVEKNLTQVELASAIGVGKSIISSWERDEAEPTLSKLIAMAKFFCCSIDYLAGLED